MTQTVERMLPLYEAKMIHQYDHRWATYEPDGTVRDATLAEKQDPEFVVLPRYWVREEVVTERLAGRWSQNWLLGWRRIARSTDERTFISTRIPRAAAGDSLFLCLPTKPDLAAALVANLCSFVFDFVARQKFGGTNASFFLVEQLPVLPPERLETPPVFSPAESMATFLARRVRSIEGTRPATYELIRAELDAAFFHLYGLTRDEVDYIMDTFPIVQRKDLAEFDEYRTKRMILEIYDAMQHAIDTGVPYTSAADLGVSG